MISYLVRAFLEGDRLIWTSVSFGNYSYWETYITDVRRPQAGVRLIGDEAETTATSQGGRLPSRETGAV